MSKINNLINRYKQPINHNGVGAVSNVQCLAKVAGLQKQAIINIEMNVEMWKKSEIIANDAMTHISVWLSLLANDINRTEKDIV